jgi:hypothetical protein
MLQIEFVSNDEMAGWFMFIFFIYCDEFIIKDTGYTMKYTVGFK